MLGNRFDMKNKTNAAFFALVRAGLWEEDVLLLPYGNIDYNKLLCLSEEQSVVGLVAAGFEHAVDTKPPQDLLLQFVGEALQLEQRNREMNVFVAYMVEEMRKADIYGLLVKGSGLAQCYTRPLWRNCCDIDFFFSYSGYAKAVSYLTSIASEVVQDSRYTKSYGIIIDNWQVELHGTLRSGLSSRLDHVIDKVQRDVFYGGDARSWMNGKTQVFLPGVNSDLFLLFTHFVRHFYHHEFILRQACDWCRFLWTYKERIDEKQLETRLRNIGMMGEWKAFAAFAVDYLGMPHDAMPFYSSKEKWKRKAEKILCFIMKDDKPNRVFDTLSMFKIFPLNTIRFLPSLLFNVNGMKILERLFKS